MIETVEQLKQERPDLVELFEGMTHEQLLNQIWEEVKDGLNMEKRVEVFMELCTNGMSYTTYTEGSIRSLVQDKWEADLSYWCKNALEDIKGMSVKEIKDYLREEIRN